MQSIYNIIDKHLGYKLYTKDHSLPYIIIMYTERWSNNETVLFSSNLFLHLLFNGWL